MKYELPEPAFLMLPGKTETGVFTADQMQAAYQAGIDSMKYEGELPELPAPDLMATDQTDRYNDVIYRECYDADSLQNYARQAIAGYRAKVGQSEPKPEPTQRQYETAMRQWNHWKSYAMELQARLVKYEGGSPMLLNTPQPAPAAQPLELSDAEIEDIGFEMLYEVQRKDFIEFARTILAAANEKAGL